MKVIWHVGEFVKDTEQTRKDTTKELRDVHHVMYTCLHMIFCVHVAILHLGQSVNPRK